MARFMALVTLPDCPDLATAHDEAGRAFPRTLVRVISTASWEIAEAERPRRRDAHHPEEGTTPGGTTWPPSTRSR
jgi:hypothetical protein